MYKIILIIASMLLFQGIGRAQVYEQVHIRFVPTFKGEKVELDDVAYYLQTGDSVVFEEFKCYISEVVLCRGNEPMFKEPRSFHLLDAQAENTMSFVLKVPADLEYNAIKMNVGVDSITSTSGALGGDLDPAKGMFWTWQSGYINMKLEGRSNLCPTRKNKFQFHLGGYEQDNNTLQTIAVNIPANKEVVIDIPLDKFLSGINLTEQNSIMSPGPEAVVLSKKMAQLFEVKQK